MLKFLRNKVQRKASLRLLMENSFAYVLFSVFTMDNGSTMPRLNLLRKFIWMVKKTRCNRLFTPKGGSKESSKWKCGNRIRARACRTMGFYEYMWKKCLQYN